MTRLFAKLLLATLLGVLAGAPAQAAADRSTATLETAARGDAGLSGVYATRKFAPLWFGSADAAPRRAVMLALLAREQRFAPAGVTLDRLSRAFAAGPASAQLDAELTFTRAAMAYLQRRAGGRVVRPEAVARVFAGLTGAKPSSDLDLGLAELRIVEALGGWSTVRLLPTPSVLLPPLTPVRAELELVPPPADRPKPQPELSGLRRRLVQSYDLGVQHLEGEEMDRPLTDAIRRFQASHGLVPDGVVGARTVTALNQGVSSEIRQVELNMARADGQGRTGLKRYIEVNIPAYELHLVEGGRVTFVSRVIVGDQDTQTPIFDDWMRYIELNPSWYVPKSIVKEIVDKEAKEPGYMSKAGFGWRSGDGAGSSRLVQRPGPENALGRLKFVFPNHHAVYIHDTPNRGLFSRSDRTLSHGCIRLEQPMALAVALLGNQGWDQARIEAALQTPATKRVRLDAPVPVFLDYRTSGLDSSGRLQLWQDIYGLDAQGVTQFAGKGLPPEQEPAPPPPPHQETVAAGEPAMLRAAGAPVAAGL